MKDPTNPTPGDQQDYSPEFDEDKRRLEHMKLTPKSREGSRDEDADRIRRLKGGGGLGGEI